MPIVFDAPVEPDALTAFVREVPVPADLALLAQVEPRFVQDNKIDWLEITRRNRTARFRSFDGRIHVSSRDTAEEKSIKLPPLSTSFNMGEYERLQLEFARTGGTRQQALANAIYNDGERGTLEVLARLEQALGDVLTDGKLTINENGYAGEADFGVPANQIVAPGTAWTDTTGATPITNLQAWVDIAVDTNGNPRPQVARTSTAVLRTVLRNKEVIDALYGSTQGKTRASLADLNDLLANEGLPTFAEPYDTQVDVDGVATRPIPKDRVVLTPADLNDVVGIVFGVSATALELVDSNQAELSFEDSPGIVGVVEKTGPPYRQFTYIDAVGMAEVKDARALTVADVGTYA